MTQISQTLHHAHVEYIKLYKLLISRRRDGQGRLIQFYTQRQEVHMSELASLRH